jgi:glycosyltransferase 2 family protein
MNILAVIGFVAGAAILTILVVYAGLGPIALAVASLGVLGLFLITFVHLPILSLLGLAWFVPARRFKAARLRNFIWARVVRDAAGELLPFSQLGGYAAGVRALTLAHMEPLPATLSMLVDLIVELLGKLPYALLGLICLAWLRAPARLLMPILVGLALSGVLMAVGLALVMRRRSTLERLAFRMAAQWPILAHSNERMRSAFAVLLAPDGRIGVAFALHFACWALGGLEAWLLFHLMGIPTGFIPAVIIDSLFSVLRTLAFFIPGAVGVQEASYALLGAMFGITPAAAIGFSLARRARDFAIGIPALAAWNIQEGRRAMGRGGASAEAVSTTRDELSLSERLHH